MSKLTGLFSNETGKQYEGSDEDNDILSSLTEKVRLPQSPSECQAVLWAGSVSGGGPGLCCNKSACHAEQAVLRRCTDAQAPFGAFICTGCLLRHAEL